MLVRDVMSTNVQLARPGDTIEQAARAMAHLDVGFLPVTDEDRLIGVVTDRDIAIRAVALGKAPSTPIGEVMTTEVRYCFDDEDLGHVARNMADQQVRRLPVMNRQKRLIGVLSLSDLAFAGKAHASGEALAWIATPGGLHTQRINGTGQTVS